MNDHNPDAAPCTNHFSDGSKIFPNRDCCDPKDARIAELERELSKVTKERDEARAEHEVKEQFSDRTIEALRAQLAASEADRLRLAKEILSTGEEADRKRLDWLEKNGDTIQRLGDYSNYLWNLYFSDGQLLHGEPNLRAAIDAAMQPPNEHATD